MVITITLNPAIDRTLVLDDIVKGSVNRSKFSKVEVGGKGINVSRAIKSLGGDTIAIGFMAGQNGRYLKDILSSMAIDYDFVDVPGHVRTNIKLLTSDGINTDINEEGFDVSDSDFLRFIDRIHIYKQNNHIFTLSGSPYKNMPLDKYYKICKEIKSNGGILLVDAQGEYLLESLKVKPDYIKPNIEELADTVGYEINSRDDIIRAAKYLISLGAGAVCVSMGAEGAMFFDSRAADEAIIVEAPKIDVRGTVAAGDAMVGAICHGINENMSFRDIARFAVAMGSASASYDGNTMAGIRKTFEFYRNISSQIIEI